MTGLRDVLAAALAGRYALEEETGAGGMAVVYRAMDRRHHRPVALKVLRPGLLRGEGAERFLREIRVLAALVHPNIVPLYDSGEVPGDPPTLYLVMPFLAGESLRARLERERRLPLDRAVGIARSVAAALHYAHRRGVIHRDIKPENIFLHEGLALVTDFGVARLLSDAGAGGVTGPGMALGTPAYMSPEQAVAETDVDGRADQYARGCVLYETLVGAPPFAGDGRAVLARHVSAPPPSVRAARPDVPPAIEAVIHRALAKDPADRYPGAAAFADALATPLAGFMPELPGRTVNDGTVSLAVMPFENVGGDPESEYLSDGLTEELIGAFSRVPGLRVVSRSSSFAFKGERRDARAIGRLLDVSYLLEGSVRRLGPKLRITAQLCSATRDEVLWTGRYDREAGDLFAVQEEIARTIVRTVRVGPLAGEPAPSARRYGANATAYGLYLKGRHAWNKRTAAGIDEAIRFFEAAVAEDPDFAPAWAGLADAYALGADYRATPVADGMRRARDLATRALELDDGLAEAHTSLAWVSFIHDWDWAAAGHHFRRAIALDPSYATARQWHSWYLAAMGKVWEAVDEGREAVRFDPTSPSIRRSAGWLWYYARDPVGGLPDLRYAVVMNPESQESLTLLGHGLAWAGEYEEADQVLREALALDPEETGTLATLARLRAFQGRPADARGVLDRMLAMGRRRYVSPSDLAKTYLALGEADAAFAALERVFEERRGLLVYLRVEPVFDPIREDPRFAALLRQLRLD
jgi:serine/threonine protein kinase/tetratricopeptide (TPR) repeat protein